MKTHLIKFTAQSIKNLPGILTAFTIVVAFSVPPKAWSADLFWAGATAAATPPGTPPVAGSGPWSTDSDIVNWSDTRTAIANASWIDGSVAHFLGSAGGNVTLLNDITAAGIDFDVGANAFAIDTNGHVLTVQGAGIVNNSETTQTITNNGFTPGGEISIAAGSTVFSGASTAGSATITNKGSAASGESSGFTEFSGASTAGNAAITNEGGAGSSAAGGFTRFLDTSTAGSATITNNGATVNGGDGVMLFFNTSTAGSATITNEGGAVNGGAGGATTFLNESTAGNATIINKGATVNGGAGGSTAFFNTSSAGSATITNNGGAVNGGGSGFTEFASTSTANKATILNNGGVVDGGPGGSTGFFDTSTAGNATITNNGGAVNGGAGGSTAFLNRSTAGNATITNNGPTVSGAFFGETVFLDTSTAGNATIINNGGKLGVSGGTTFFTDSSDGGAARAITNGNGSFDISRLTTAGMGIGSIEGSGTYFLGSKRLSVGGNNLSTTVSGVIQDGGFGGSLTKVGTGTLTLTGNNTYRGGTTISAGTLQLGNGGTTGSITGDVIDNGILVFDRSNVLTFGGMIMGSGSVQQNGTGTTVLVRDNDYSGATTVNAGSLIVDGSIASAQTLVNAGGLLGGRGSLGGDLVSNGIVSPGDSPGTLTVKGNYTQNASGTLRIEVASVTEHDLLAVGGHASLAGTLQFISLGGFKLHVGDQLKFLTANGGISGTFDTVQNPFVTGTIVKSEVVYLPDAVVLEGTQGSFVPVACTPNAVAVAHALDSAVGNSGSAELINFLDEQPINQLCNDLQLIAPEQLASIFNVGVSLANVQTANLNRRMEDIRAGSTGFSAAGFTLNGSAPNFGGGFAGVTGPEGKSGPSPLTPTPENRWGVWVTGIGEFTNVDSTENAPGYDLQTGGLTLGVDYRVSPNFAIGLTAGYAHTKADLANGGDLDVNSGSLGLYATVFGGGFYIDTAVTGGPSGYSTHRTALLGSANGSTDGGDLNVLVAAGYDWKKGGLTIGPTASFQYTYVGLGGFTESGSLAPLDIHSQNAESERTALGMKASYDVKVGQVVIVPQISLAWQHEFGDQAYSIVASFANGAGNNFTVNSPAIGRDSMLIGAGAAVLLSERVSIYAYYDGELLRTNYQSNNVSAGIRVTF